MRHWLSVDFIGFSGCQWLPVAVSGRHWLLLVVTGSQWLSLDVTGFQLKFVAVIAVTGFYWLSVDIVGCHGCQDLPLAHSGNIKTSPISVVSGK